MTTAGGSGYDTLNRLVAAQASSGPYQGMQAAWSYDSFGNRTSESFGLAQGAQVTAPIPPSTAVTPAISNQIQSIRVGTANYTPSYDASGDVTVDPSSGNHYAYDGEGRICAMESTATGGPSYTGYVYNAGGTRVAKGSLTSLSCNLAANGFALSNQYLLDLGGDQVTELNGSGNWVHSNVWAGAHLDATYDSYLSGVQFHLSDPLGTRRIETNYAGDVDGSYQSLPFGDGLVITGSDATEHHFTGKERDTESGNDYFGARYYASSMGRFLSPDWSAKEESVPYAKLDNPQTLNLYGYMRNNPLGGVDQDGHCDWCQKLWNAVTGNGWNTNAQLAAQQQQATVTTTETYSVNPNDISTLPQMTNVQVDPFSNTVVQAGAAYGIGTLGPVSYTHLTLPTICSV